MPDKPYALPGVSTKSLVEALMGAIVDGIITIDKRGSIQTVNPATEKIFGYRADELVGRNIKMLMPEPFKSEHDSYLENYLTTGVKKIIGIGREVTGQRKNGECFPLELAISDLEVDGQTMFAGIIRDISERKKFESDLITSSKRLALATAAGGVGVWDFDPVSGTLVWDERMFEMYGVDKNLFSGLYEAWRNALHPEDLESAEQLFQTTLATGVPFDTVFRIIKKDKSIHYIQAHAQALRDENNQVNRVIGVNIDTTETKRLTFEYQARENRIRALMNTIVDGIIVINAMGQIQSMNPAAEALFGYSQQELEGKNIKMLMPEPYRSAHDGFLHNYRTTGIKKIIGSGREVVGLRRDGSTFPMELAVSEAEVGGEILFTGVVRDISERKEVFDQLNLQSGALEAAANAILITDSQGIIEWVNSAFTRLTGYSNDEVKGKSTRMLKSGKQPPNFYQNLWDTVTDGRVWQGEMINKRKDGSLYTEEQTITPVVDSKGNIRNFIAIKLDISERKEAEAALAEKTQAIEAAAEFERTHSKIMTLFNSYSDPHDLLDQMLKVLAQSHQLHLSAVFLINEWHGRLDCVASYGLPSSAKRHVDLGDGFIGQAAMSEQTLMISAEEMPLKIDVGLFEIAPTTILALPISHSNKTLGVLVLASIHPLSETEVGFLERLANQIGISLNNQTQYQHLKELSEQLKQRGKEISKKNAQLEQNNRLKTEFLANMSHELRTPLNAIIGFSEVLKDQLLGDLNEEQSDYIGEIFDSANHLLSLINDILDLSKIEAGRMELALEVVNIPEAITNSISIIKEKAYNHGITTQLHISKEIGCAKVDSRKFKQILYNLLSNAVKFTPDGGSIKIDAVLRKGRLIVAITDTGIGIPDDQIDQLFKPFVQLDGSLSRHYEGTGLGLAMVRRLVELHKGTVTVTSKVGEGSCFEFSIPYIEDAGLIDDLHCENETISAPIHSSEPVRPTDLRPTDQQSQTLADTNAEAATKTVAEVGPSISDGNTILIIEADANTARDFRRQLTDAGYRVIQAQDEDSALSAALQHRPDLIVLDIMIPDAQGWALIKKLKQHKALNSIPITSIAMEASKGIPLGVVNVLEKPILKRALLDSIAHQLQPTAADRYTILVVDDEASSVKFICDQLEEFGFKTLPANSGSQALELLANTKPDLMILDIMMPGMSGFEVIAKIRTMDTVSQTPVIILTAKILSEDEKKILDSSVHDIIDKCEFKPENFIELIQMNMRKLGHIPSLDSNHTQTKDKPTILIIEENEAQSDLLYLYLTDAGYRVLVASDTHTGLELMQNRIPDLITLNILPAQADDDDFIRTLSSNPEFSNIPVMLLSGADTPSGNYAIPADAVLSKPIKRSEILQSVEKLIPKSTTDQSQKSKILLIDDDPKALKIVSSYLSESEFIILTALSGADGIAMVESDSPDLIILDLMMPEMSGVEVISRLKKSKKMANIPIVLLTSKQLTQSERRMLENQVASIASKGPRNKKSLSQDVKRILKRYHRA